MIEPFSNNNNNNNKRMAKFGVKGLTTNITLASMKVPTNHNFWTLHTTIINLLNIISTSSHMMLINVEFWFFYNFNIHTYQNNLC